MWFLWRMLRISWTAKKSKKTVNLEGRKENAAGKKDVRWANKLTKFRMSNRFM